MTARPIPRRTIGGATAPAAHGALVEPFNAFPSWVSDHVRTFGQERIVNQVHAAQSDLPIRDVLRCATTAAAGAREGGAAKRAASRAWAASSCARIVLREG